MLAYDLRTLPSQPVELSFPVSPATGVLSGYYVTGIDLQADRLVVQNAGSRQTPIVEGVNVLLNWTRKENEFVAAPANLEAAELLSLSGNMTALALNDPLNAQAKVFSAGFTNPVVLPIPNSENVLTAISLSPMSLAVGQGNLDASYTSHIGRVVLFNRTNAGEWISAGKLELTTEHIFADNFEDVL